MRSMLLLAFCCGVWCSLTFDTSVAAQSTAKPQVRPGTQTTPDKPKTTPDKSTTTPDKVTPQEATAADAKQTPATTQTRTRIAAAQEAKASGGLQRAAAIYEAAVQDASASDGQTRAQFNIAFAQTLESLAQATGGGTSPESAQHLTRASDLYRSALETGTPTQKQLARNNLGTLLLRQEKYAEAVRTLEQLDLAAEPQRRFLYEYNLARALELAGRKDDAFSRYLGAIRSQPAFVEAREAATRLVVSERPLNTRNAEALGTVLISRGHPAAAASLSREMLRVGDTGTAEHLLRLLMRAYVGMSIERGAFEREEVPFLRDVSRSDRVRAYTQEIERAVLDLDLPVAPNGIQAERLFPAWTDHHAMELSQLLKYMGDVDNRAGKYQQALARYSTAWAIDRGNSEAAVYAAMLLQDHPDLDRDQRALNLLIEDLFAVKSAAIAKRDWPNILRMHLVLGTIFEKLERWGPERDPRSATFQWSAALNAEREVLQRNPSFSRSPGLYMKLGEAYLRLTARNPQRAREQFLNAAKAFEESGRVDEAAEARARAASFQR